MLYLLKRLSQSTVLAIAAVAIAVTGAIARPLQEIQQIAQATTVLIDGLNPGSGVIVAQDRDQYWVLTAQHVIATEDEYWVVAPDGVEYPLLYDSRQVFPGKDLVLVPFRSTQTYQTAQLANYPRPEGDFAHVFVSGWQGSNIHQQPLTHQLNVGQLLPRQYGLVHAHAPITKGYGLFYTSTTEQGMSGGPILDTEGQVIGIHGRSEGEELASSTGPIRIHWGFSSGLPLPDNLTRQVRSSANWQYGTQPPPPPSPSDLSSYNQLLTDPQTQPHDTVGWINLGNQLYRQEKFSQALAAFQTALDSQVELYQAWYGIAQVLNTTGDYSGALTAYNHVLALEPEFAQALRDRALVRILAGQPQQAVADLDRAVQTNPDDYVSWYLRGNLFWRYLGWNEAALGSYDRALTIAPNFAEVWVERGRVLSLLGDGKNAIASLQNATRLGPNLVNSWYWLAVLLHAENQPMAALDATQKVLAVEPENLNYLLLDAQIRLELQQASIARERLLQILTLAPSDSPQATAAQSLLQQL